MTRLAAALIAVFSCGCYCGARIVQLPAGASAPGQSTPAFDIVGLLPDPETGKIGRAIVSSPLGGSVELNKKGNATRVAMGSPPSGPFMLSAAQAEQLFGDALAARPPAPRHFLLYFEVGSNRLTPRSEQLLAQILVFVTNRPVPDVTVTGHTDTTGTARDNIELGRSRATLIHDRLIAAGLDSSLVSMASHGEADPLVATADDTPEPRNRRVEVSVR